MSHLTNRPGPMFKATRNPGINIVEVSIQKGRAPNTVDYFVGIDEEFADFVNRQPIEERKARCDRMLEIIKNTLYIQFGLEPQ